LLADKSRRCRPGILAASIALRQCRLAATSSA
jgi:hypothetical protein